jgi:acetoin utilization deacetylase AcuC-like enzyme
LFISAGFDAFEHDPLAGMRVTHRGFGQMAQRLRYAADRASSGRIISILEGGYDLDGLAGGMTAVLGALTTPAEAPAISPLPSTGTLARAAIDGTLAAHAAAGSPIPAAETFR